MVSNSASQVGLPTSPASPRFAEWLSLIWTCMHLMLSPLVSIEQPDDELGVATHERAWLVRMGQGVCGLNFQPNPKTLKKTKKKTPSPRSHAYLHHFRHLLELGVVWPHKIEILVVVIWHGRTAWSLACHLQLWLRSSAPCLCPPLLPWQPHTPPHSLGKGLAAGGGVGMVDAMWDTLVAQAA